ncbi:MAG: hypothetical protein GY854_29975 [Deltaproteobacteria bacterium]|nr:hypothetical protein [Deltaproteobacteria bacterium]
MAQFNRHQLNVLPIGKREHLLSIGEILPLKKSQSVDINFRQLAPLLIDARKRGSTIVLMIGAHVIRRGVQRYLIDLIDRGFVSCIAVNGAGIIHDYEFSLIGATTESVAKYIRDGQFGLWREIGRINDIVKRAQQEKKGLGEAVGQAIVQDQLPNADLSLLGAAWRAGVAVTAHVGIGYDIVAEHANFDGGAWGETSYRDFLGFAEILSSLEGGVVMNFGSAVMAPEVFLKALAMVRNRAGQNNRKITDFTTLVCDLVPLPDDYHKEAEKSTAGYYFRPWKTMLVRTVQDGGRSLYVRGDHARTVPELWTALVDALGEQREVES